MHITAAQDADKKRYATDGRELSGVRPSRRRGSPRPPEMMRIRATSADTGLPPGFTGA